MKMLKHKEHEIECTIPHTKIRTYCSHNYRCNHTVREQIFYATIQLFISKVSTLYHNNVNIIWLDLVVPCIRKTKQQTPREHYISELYIVLFYRVHIWLRTGRDIL